MKKKFFTCFTAIVLAGAATNVVSSQDLNNTAKLPSPVALEKNFYPLQQNSRRNPAPLHLNEVASKAIRDFNKFYKNAGDAKWFRLTDGTDGFVAFFNGDGIQTRVLYDKKGNYYCCFRHYFEDKLPPAVRHRIKTIYYDFNIYHITEVNMNNKTVFAIMIEDKTCWKQILVADGEEIVIMKEFSKS